EPGPPGSGVRTGSATIGSGLAGRLAGAADADRSLLEPADALDLERLARGGERLDQVVRVLDRLAGDLDDQVALDNARLGGRARVLDAAHEQPVALRQADRTAQAPGHEGRGHGDPQPSARRRLTA